MKLDFFNAFMTVSKYILQAFLTHNNN